MQEVANEYLTVSEEWEPGDSILMKKLCAAMEYAYPTLKNFPKVERFSLAADIRKNMDNLLEHVTDCDNKHHKKTPLQKADTANKKLKKYIRLAYRLKYISPRQYKHWSELHAEIGRIIGERLKTAI